MIVFGFNCMLNCGSSFTVFFRGEMYLSLGSFDTLNEIRKAALSSDNGQVFSLQVFFRFFKKNDSFYALGCCWGSKNINNVVLYVCSC